MGLAGQRSESPTLDAVGPEDEEGVVSDVVSYAVVDRVAHVTIERPDRRNAMDLEVFDQLAEHAERAATDRVGAVVVTGRGGHFSSGLDIAVLGSRLAGGPEDATHGIDRELIARLQASLTAYEDLEVPTIAAIEGYCFGAGLQLALACHVRAVAVSAELSVLEARWGLVPDLGGTWRLPRAVGLGRATEMVLTARRVGADEALAVGLAERRLGDDPQAEAHAFAARLASGPGALRRIPRLVRDNLTRSRDAALAAEAEAQLVCLDGPDFREAVTAHVADRDPTFVGR